MAEEDGKEEMEVVDEEEMEGTDELEEEEGEAEGKEE